MEINGYNVLKVMDDNKTAILIQDKDDKGYTGFYEEATGVVVEGDTVDETLNNLREVYKVFIECK